MTPINNIFKNSGIRDKAKKKITIIDRFINIFYRPKNTFITFNNITTLGYALAAYLHKTEQKPCSILVATDTRPSGSWIKKQLLYGLVNSGHHIFDAGIAPTPFVAKALKDYKNLKTEQLQFQLGIVITASHNPAAYNGIKIITPTGYLTVQDEIMISNFFHIFSADIASLIEFDSFDAGTVKPFNITPFYAAEIKKELHLFPFPPIKIVVDCAHGATYQVAQELFQHFGLCPIIINHSNDGRRINLQSGCSDPKLLIQAIEHHQAEWGCAFDGDGDRVIIADNKGNIYDGDDILLVLSQHQDYCNEKTFVGTIMCNQAVENYFNSCHKTLIRTDVGERNIIQKLYQLKAQIGSEPCGHITIMHHAFCSDGIFTALKFFETICLQQKIDLKPYKKFPQVQTTIALNKITLNDQMIQSFVTPLQQSLLPGRIIVRKSNTEPLLRLMIEHPDSILAQQVLMELTNQLQK